MDLSPYKISTETFRALPFGSKKLTSYVYAPYPSERFGLERETTHILCYDGIYFTAKNSTGESGQPLTVFRSVPSNSDKLFRALGIREMWEEHKASK